MRLLNVLRDSPWNDRSVRRETARYALEALEALEAQEPVTTWVIDDAGFPKQGTHSVGVQCQYTGALGKVGLTASSATLGAPGARPGMAMAGLGQGGVDAVVGASRGLASMQGSYIVSGISLGLVKSVVSVRDALGGSLVMPGSVLTYRIVLSLAGTGVAENLTFADPLPAGTSYLPETLAVDGLARSDAADTDNASFATGTVSVLFGNTTVPATRVIEFKATVN